MHAKEIFDKALNSNYLILNDNELKSVLNNSEIIREEDTHISDLIRIISFDSKIFVQEISFKKEIFIRKMSSIEDAEKFIEERLEFYERKWDGCGCMIDYYE